MSMEEQMAEENTDAPPTVESEWPTHNPDHDDPAETPEEGVTAVDPSPPAIVTGTREFSWASIEATPEQERRARQSERREFFKDVVINAATQVHPRNNNAANVGRAALVEFDKQFPDGE